MNYKEALEKIRLMTYYKAVNNANRKEHIVPRVYEVAKQALANHKEVRLYSEEEVVALIENDLYSPIINEAFDDRGERMHKELSDYIKLKLQSLQPKTEEVEIESENKCDSLEGDKWQLANQPQEQPSPSIEKEIEVTGQEQSSEIVKELNWLHNKLWATGWKGFTVLESERGALAFHNAYTQLKANNNFEELEAIKTVMGNIKTKEQAIQFLKDAGIELEEQPSPSIKKEDKISKLTFDKEISQWVDIYSYELGLIKGKEEGYKVNNSLDIAIAHYEKLSEEGSNQAYVVAKYLKTLKP